MQTYYNPDVLTCLANLSNDEVFTSPRLVNEILDQLPKSIWRDKHATFLDPVAKSGVFLREISKRLMTGLEHQIPDLQKRANHIYENQVFGIAITELTSLLARRSIYCSKTANGKYSICESFNNAQGNILYGRIEHTWVGGGCKFCGATQEMYDRSLELETHAYQFIHTDNPKEIFKGMRFDVVVGNPPYQLGDGGYGTSAKPIYHHFVQQAKRLNPRYMTMIIPARWYSGGKGLDEFRAEMLGDDRLRRIVDFPEAIDCFPGVQIKGGVCYFLWDRDHRGFCEVATSEKGEITSEMTRPLLEKGASTFIRYNEAIPILNKVRAKNEPSIRHQISSSKPFGLRTNYRGKEKPFRHSIKIYQKGGIGYVAQNEIKNNVNLINKYKVFIPPLGSGSDSFPHPILGKPFVVGPNTVCTETYLVAGSFESEAQAKKLAAYLNTRFLRFLVLLNKPAQHATAKVYQFVPLQDFKLMWNDEKLYEKYGLTQNEIKFIESKVRSMELDDGS